MKRPALNQRWTQRPEGSNWGDFGADDQRGRLNFLTPEKVLQGISEVRTGLTFCLSLPLDYPGGNLLNQRRHPPHMHAVLRNGRPYYNYRWNVEQPGLTDVSSDEAVLLYSQYSTQWDSLAHVGSRFDADGDGVAEAVYYNGYRGDKHVMGPPQETVDGKPVVEPVCARALGIENMAATGVQGRGVLVDLHSRCGRERRAVGYDMLMRIMEDDDVVIEKGDMLCVHTGFAQMLLDMKKDPDPALLHSSCAVLDGHDNRLLRWIDDSGIAVLISDNHAVEARPQQFPQNYNGPALPLHEHCLFKLGIHLGELWYLTELAGWLRTNKRSRFLLTAPPLRLPGAVGSPVTPVATV
ncbi:MAG TPA: cyclase family protein [Burkholderiales bacterium]|nr:cyclase family protein [Burkholderiales bacterium]